MVHVQFQMRILNSKLVFWPILFYYGLLKQPYSLLLLALPSRTLPLLGPILSLCLFVDPFEHPIKLEVPLRPSKVLIERLVSGLLFFRPLLVLSEQSVDQVVRP